MTEDRYAILRTLNNSGLDLVAYVVEMDFQNAMKYTEKDDLVGYGVMGLLSAARKYDHSKGVSFVTFACKKIRQEIISFIRQKCQQRYKYLDEIDGESTPNPSRGESTPNPSRLRREHSVERWESYDDEDERAYVRRMVNDLPEPHRQFVKMYYWRELSTRELLKVISLKKNMMFKLRTQSIALLRVKMVHG